MIFISKRRVSELLCALLTAGALVLTSCSSAREEIPVREPVSDYHKRSGSYEVGHGSAGKLQGRTVVISLFASDPQYEWTYDDDDKCSISDIRDYLNIAAVYLQDAAASYGGKVWFTTDFIDDPDLMYNVTLDEVITTIEAVDSCHIQDQAWEFIEENIDEDGIRDRYRADNIVYMMFLNTDRRTTAVSCTVPWYPYSESDAEVVFLFNYDYGQVNPPAVYAHEILHTFGAPDLYYCDTEYGMSAAFLDYVESDLSNEIMYTCSDPVSGNYRYDAIVNEMSDLTAYYVGIIDHSDIAEEWGLTDPY